MWCWKYWVKAPINQNKKPREKTSSLGVLYDPYPVKFPKEIIEQSYL